jgi:hypothetical protein
MIRGFVRSIVSDPVMESALAMPRRLTDVRDMCQ